ncbi:hypothetical protein O7627_35445 [Solwaraspora sp. WMMD1047]|uniref:hypothetical protein n=1 Tax=Solwaraspora sp. WMMD1047 TaxID=3016102 RepID=UPI0024171C73|nr:hypothetical protein [Solwaraspora sp. WMMD1047]MDG4834566.1 hypothetical protein [Solwaraspora sp. WMMD1047]
MTELASSPTDDAPAKRRRPDTVTVAGWLQAAAAVLLVLAAASVVVEAVRFDAVIDRAVAAVPDADPAEVAAERSTNIAIPSVLVAICLIFAAWLAGCVRPLLRGSGVARLLTLVGGGVGLFLCVVPAPCLAFGAFGFGVAGFASGWEGEPIPEPSAGAGEEAPPWDFYYEESEFYEALYAEPDPVSEVLAASAVLAAVLAILLTVAVLVLLVLPASRRYFGGGHEPPAPVPLIPVPPGLVRPGPIPPPAAGPAPGWPVYPGGYWPAPGTPPPGAAALGTPAPGRPAPGGPASGGPAATGPAPGRPDPSPERSDPPPT